MDEKTLLLLASRVRSKFRGRYPGGVTASDCYNDAIVLLLQLEPALPDRKPATVDPCAWLVTRAHGDLRDRYSRLWRGDNAVHVVCPIDPGVGPTVGPTQESSDAGIDTRAAIDRLRGVERRVMRLHLDGETQEQIAVTIGRTQPYVSQIMQKAKKKLGLLLAAYGDPQ